MIVSLSYLIIYKSNFYFFRSFLPFTSGHNNFMRKISPWSHKKKYKIILSITRFGSLFPLVPSVSFYLSNSSFLSIRSRLKKIIFLGDKRNKKKKKKLELIELWCNLYRILIIIFSYRSLSERIVIKTTFHSHPWGQNNKLQFIRYDNPLFPWLFQ